MASEKTLEWRKQKKEFIEEWQRKIKDMRLRISLEGWSEDKFEMEILQLIDDQELKDVFLFAKFYIFKYKKGGFRKFMVGIYDEIINYGTIEASSLSSLKQRIKTAKRKMT